MAIDRDGNFRLDGRVLLLTEDASDLQRQLDGQDLPFSDDLALTNNISTDEITPGWVCFHYDATLGRFALIGLRGGLVKEGSLQTGGFEVVVSGASKGCGSSREHAPFAELAAGVRLVIARSVEKIYAQNCQNIGLLTSTDLGLVQRLRQGEAIPLSELTQGLDPISRDVVQSGGLFAYNRRRMAGELRPPALSTPARPMTLAEKILAAHAVQPDGTLGTPAVTPGDALFARSDVRFSHEYVTPMADALFREGFGEDARLRGPSSVFVFRDHLTFLGEVLSEEKKKQGLLQLADKLADVQARFAQRHGVRLYGESERGGSEAICHNAVFEELALPGQVVTGTDSHTCMAGALGCLAFGVGTTDMANAWYTEDVRVRVPDSVRVALLGQLGAGVCAKDVMLHLLAQPFFRTSKGIGKVLEFVGEGVRSLNLDERATLANMAVEAGGFTGIVEADERVVDYLLEMRSGLNADALRSSLWRSDPDASYAAHLEVDLSAVRPMVATPGDPRNGIPLADVTEDTPIHIAYGGSCTGGKKADMDMYASVFAQARDHGQRIAEGVECYIQFGSQRIRDYAEQCGYVQLFETVGVKLIAPSCGACINAGPGASKSPDQVAVSAINRNFPGRSGPGQVYLASPYTVAASALAGRLAGA